MKSIHLCILFLMINPIFQQNYSLDFDGSMDYVQIDGGSALLSNTSDMTISGWVYLRNYNSGWPDFDGLFGVRNEANADFYILQHVNFQLEGRLRNSNNEVFSVDTEANLIQPEQWQHVALTYNGEELKLYLNGVLAGNTSASGQINNSGEPFIIGSVFFQENDFDLDGLADDIRIWSRALSQEDIMGYMDQDVSGEEDLIGYWKFNEGTGNTVSNSVSDNYHGYFSGDPTWSENTSPVQDQFCGLPGDVNGDDSLDVTDIVTVVSAIIDHEYDDVICADMNEDEIINVLDIVSIVNLIMGI